MLTDSDKLTITGAHSSKGRKDLGVKFVEFSASNISHIPDQVFKKFPNLEYLSVNTAGIKKINQLVNATDLKVILANNNQISSLDANTFEIATDLETLSLRKNQIEEIHVNAFHLLGNLRELYLSDNRVLSLHINTFSPLISLEILAMSGNQLQTIDIELFATNLQLREILLYDNKITAIHPQTFGSLSSLFNLELHGNLCVDKDVRQEGYDDKEFQDAVKNHLKQCFADYPKKDEAK
jgi:Leucine-rich repeat (LRR) protein